MSALELSKMVVQLLLEHVHDLVNYLMSQVTRLENPLERVAKSAASARSKNAPGG